MSASLDTIEVEARSLSPKDRAELVLHLLDSLENRPVADEAAVKSAWIAKADARYQALMKGEDSGLRHEDMFAGLRSDNA